MGQDPKEAWRRLQQTLASAQQRSGTKPLGGSPRNFLGGVGALLLFGGGAVALSNALFNGNEIIYSIYMKLHC